MNDRPCRQECHQHVKAWGWPLWVECASSSGTHRISHTAYRLLRLASLRFRQSSGIPGMHRRADQRILIGPSPSWGGTRICSGGFACRTCRRARRTKAWRCASGRDGCQRSRNSPSPTWTRTDLHQRDVFSTTCPNPQAPRTLIPQPHRIRTAAYICSGKGLYSSKVGQRDLISLECCLIATPNDLQGGVF